MGKTLTTFLIVASQLWLPANAGDATMRLGLSGDFGGKAGSWTGIRVNLGLSATTVNDALVEPGLQYLASTGIQYSTRHGLSPMLLGMPLTGRPSVYRASGESGDPWYTQWGWVAAGAALLAGAVIVAADGDETDGEQASNPGSDDDEFTDENTCVGPGIDPDHVDTDCLGG